MRLSQEVRATDSISRIGGDEFTIILNTINIEMLISIVTKLFTAMEAPFDVLNHKLHVTISIGITICPDDSSDVDVLLKNADSAMYKAKFDGRNTYQFYTKEMTQKAYDRLELETSMHEGLNNSDFVVFYQPQFEAKSNKIIGMEGLVRWLHPSKGLLQPVTFLPLAYELGLISKLDKIVMDIAMKQIKIWYDEGLNPGVLALNLSMKLLNENSFVETLINLLESNGVKAEWIEIEVTETHIMKNPENAITALEAISDYGIKISVDDFGTGYSSLSYLKRLPIDKLKIDKSFVDNVPNDDEDVAITKAVIGLATTLNLKVIAEGVETQEQKEFLLANGCAEIQGYFYSKPLNNVDMREMLMKNKKA